MSGVRVPSLDGRTFAVSSAQLESVQGISKYIKPNEVDKLFDPLIRTASYAKDEHLQMEAATRIGDEYWSLPGQLDGQFLTRLDNWVEFLVEKERTEAADRIAAIRDSISSADDDIPF